MGSPYRQGPGARRGTGRTYDGVAAIVIVSVVLVSSYMLVGGWSGPIFVAGIAAWFGWQLLLRSRRSDEP